VYDKSIINYNKEYGGSRNMKKEAGVTLDMGRSGQLLNYVIRKRGYTVSEIQKELGLACPQPVYRWLRGQTMPSIDNLYSLSKILKIHMDDLVVSGQDREWLVQWCLNQSMGQRLRAYYQQRMC